MIRRPPRSTQSRSSAASDVYKRQVDGGRLAEKSHLCRERRLVARLAAVALDRVHQRGFLTADVGAGAAPQLDVEGKAFAHDVVAQHASSASLGDGILEPVGREGVLAPDVDVAALGAGR